MLSPRRPVWRGGSNTPKVTVLKPLCGAEPESYLCLRSFCDQDYPEFQVVFGIADPSDPVLAVVQRLQREFPQRDLQISIDSRQHGSSRKISNLINMMTRVSHDHLVLADSDVRVERIISQQHSCATVGPGRRYRHLSLPRHGAPRYLVRLGRDVHQ
jgi:ceramide glucosyltransferase